MSEVSFFCMYISICPKRLLYPFSFLGIFVRNKLTISVYFWALISIPSINICILVPVPYFSYLFFSPLATPHSTWDLRFPTRDWTCAPCIGNTEFNQWTIRKGSTLLKRCQILPPNTILHASIWALKLDHEWASLVAQMVKVFLRQTWVWSLVRKSPGGGNGTPLQDSCLENPMDGGAWWATWGRKESDTTERLHWMPHTGV